MKKHNLIFLSVIFLIILVTNINAITDSFGKYYIKPSFKVELDYNPFNDYKVLIEKVKTLLMECPNEESCINDKIDVFNAEHNNLVLSLGSCDKRAKKIFYDFIENYKSCTNSQDSDCICEFDLDFNSYDLKGEYKIKLSKNKKIESEDFTYILDNIPSYTANDPSEESKTRDYVDYFVKYNDDGSFNSAKLGLERDNWFDAQWDYNAIKLHKTNDGKLVFVKEYDVTDPNLKYCTITKNIFKFCAVNKNAEFYFYDPVIGEVILQNPTIKFALYMEDLPPPPIENLKIYDKKKDDKSIILEWDKSKASDVKQYLIYYSKDDFLDWKIKNHEAINKNKKIKPIGLDSGAKPDNILQNIDLKEPFCHFDISEEKCVFEYYVQIGDGSLESIKLEEGEVYLINEQKYIYTLNLEDYEEYNFAVTAVDIAGNEIDNVNEKWKLNQGKNYAQGKAEDDLAPGIVKLNEPEIKTKDNKKVIELSWSKTLKNIDGTPIKDEIDYYNVYYKEEDFDFIDDSLNVKPKVKDTTLNIDLNEFDEGKTYHFSVTAVDIAGNGFKERVITKEKKIIK